MRLHALLSLSLVAVACESRRDSGATTDSARTAVAPVASVTTGAGRQLIPRAPDCTAGGRALAPLLDSTGTSIRYDEQDTGIGLLLPVGHHRNGEPLLSGVAETPAGGASLVVTVRAQPEHGAPTVARFEQMSDDNYPDCQYVTLDRSESLSTGLVPALTPTPEALVVDSLTADSLWARVVYAIDSARTPHRGWVRVGDNGSAFVSWPRLLAASVPGGSQQGELEFRSRPTETELRALLRAAPGSAGRVAVTHLERLEEDPPFLSVEELRGDWARVRLVRGEICNVSQRRTLGTGWIRLVDDRGRTRLRPEPPDACAD